MKAVAVYPRKQGPVHLREVKKPIPTNGEVIIRALEVGVCGTDREIVNGLYGDAPYGSDFLILGHESLGIAESDGVDVKKGDMVVATVRRPCPEHCLNCTRGEIDMCLTGNYREKGIKGLHGFMTEYYTEDPKYLVRVPQDLRHVAILLEPLSVVEKVIEQIFKIQKRLEWEPRTALVLGAGPIGLLSTFVLRDIGITTYTFARSPSGRLNDRLIEESGAHYLSATDTPLSYVPSKIGQIDLIVEATGSASLPFEAICVLGINGIIALTGIAGQGRILEIDTSCINLKMVLENKLVFGSVNANKSHFETGVRRLKSIEERWPGVLRNMITRRVPIQRFQEALEKGDSDMKVVIEV